MHQAQGTLCVGAYKNHMLKNSEQQDKRMMITNRIDLGENV